VTAPAPPQRGFDPEAEQEVDFAHYVRLLGMRWWLLAAGLVAGAVIGYLISLGGNQVYSAAATVYLGQPYTPSGGAQVTNPQTNPSSVGQVINNQSVDNTVANLCHTSASEFQKGISTQAVATGVTSKSGATINPLVKVSVQAKKGKLAACAANGLANEVVKKLGTYAEEQDQEPGGARRLRQRGHQEDPDAIASSSVSDTDKLILQTNLRPTSSTRRRSPKLLLLAKNVESHEGLANAASHKITASARHASTRRLILVALLVISGLQFTLFSIWFDMESNKDLK
jgi:capsular polysaccharide biosynthesis protein